MDGPTPAPRTTTTNPDLLIGGSDQAFRALVYRLLTISGRMEALREEIAESVGLTGIQYHVLMAITELETGSAPVNVGRIARTLHKTGAYVTIETGKLARMGLVAKTPNPEDGRGVLLSVTPEGSALIDAIGPYLSRINDALFEGIDVSLFAKFREIAAIMTDNTEDALALAEALNAEKSRRSRRAERNGNQRREASPTKEANHAEDG